VLKQQAKESAAAAAAAKEAAAKAIADLEAAGAAHQEEGARLRRIARKKAEELEELQVGMMTVTCAIHHES
jgi:hypothetical protein